MRTMFLSGRCRHRHVGQPHRMNHRPGIPLVVGVAWCARRTLDRSTAGIMFIISVRYAPGPVVVICLHPGGPAHDDWIVQIRMVGGVGCAVRTMFLLVVGVPWCARRTLPHDRRYRVASVGVLRLWARGRYLFTPRRASARRLNRPNTNGWWRRVRRAHHVLSATWPLHR